VVGGLTKEHITTVFCEACGYKLREIVRHMRNAIAHLDIKTTNDNNGKIETVRFKDRSKFIAEIPVKELKTFVIKLNKHVMECKKVQK